MVFLASNIMQRNIKLIIKRLSNDNIVDSVDNSVDISKEFEYVHIIKPFNIQYLFIKYKNIIVLLVLFIFLMIYFTT